MKHEFKSALFNALLSYGRYTILDLYKLGSDLELSDDAKTEIDMVTDVSYGRAAVHVNGNDHIVWRRIYGNEAPTAIFIDRAKSVCACLDYQGCVNWLNCSIEHYGNYTAIISYDTTLIIWNNDDAHVDVDAEMCAAEKAPDYACSLFNAMSNGQLRTIDEYALMTRHATLPIDIAACISSYSDFQQGNVTVKHLPDGSYKIMSKEEYGDDYYCLLIAGDGSQSHRDWE